ncbi:hypothetical protein K457DRAFT_15211 [Linnemannia elongata AG-77]|uniref:Uncharacterized protein n=1 Tax=Linnemannia elongata AG-77 TaxID=1314771 RepID=A0A197KC94_9FUNG|nr:hypothetical protein K457DRAFT_15211 [Linnemannia elongata AG-77]
MDTCKLYTPHACANFLRFKKTVTDYWLAHTPVTNTTGLLDQHVVGCFLSSQPDLSVISIIRMSFKITQLIALAFAMLLVVMSTHQVEAQQIPIWCTCDSPYYSSLICNNIANGKWDGGSCGLDKYNSYIRFVDACKNSKDSKHQLHCWN